MPAIRTALLVGSIEQLAAQTFTVNSDPATLPQGNYYPIHATPALSLAAQLVALALAEAGITIEAWLGRDLRFHLHRAAGTWSLTWGAATTFRELLGFTGNLSGSQTYHAPNISPLIWSPGWPATKSTIDGVPGYPIEDEVTETSADGSETDTDYHHTQVWDEFAWDSVFHNRVRRPPSEPQGGTWHEFRRRVLVPNHRFQLYESIIEDASSTTAMSGTAVATYQRRQLPSGTQERKISNANTLWKLGFEVTQQGEYA